ncbi:CarD family transcriptional regulator [Treponema pectinovorum]|uniref:CarD family transcriptional regulator n=1 Tax=Treponema pectinovorum TaxID=164 RepID=UPI0011CACB8B|nr:CarD family transcriptional regulator [Treponema pectinovorum]
MSTQFLLNEKVVYPSQGVGEIKEIFDRKNGEQIVQYYRIYLEVSDMIVMVPVANSEKLGIRKIVSADEAQKALEILGEPVESVTSDWKLRYQMNLDLLKKGSIEDITNIVRTLYHRSKVKELPIQERKLYDTARKLLTDEISLALGISTKEIEAMLHAKLEVNAIHEKKAVQLDSDDDDDDEFGDDLTASSNNEDDDSDERDDSDDEESDDDGDES